MCFSLTAESCFKGILLSCLFSRKCRGINAGLVAEVKLGLGRYSLASAAEVVVLFLVQFKLVYRNICASQQLEIVKYQDKVAKSITTRSFFFKLEE